MAHITITPAQGRWIARAGGTIIADTTKALELREGGAPPVIYVPRTDAMMDQLTRTERATTCPHKGVASHYSAPGQANAIWSYEAPKSEVAAISGHLAFYTSKITLEQA